MKALAKKMRIARNASDKTIEILDRADHYAEMGIDRRLVSATLRAQYESSQLVEAAQAIQPLDEFDPMRAIDIILDNAYSEPVSNKTFAALLVICGLAGVIAAIFLR